MKKNTHTREIKNRVGENFEILMCALYIKLSNYRIIY